MTKSNFCKKVIPISFEEAKKILDSDNDSILLDVRTIEEYADEHASGAMLFPLDDITAERAERLIPNKNTAVLLYCRTGHRSGLAAGKLISFGYQRIYDLGGLTGWPYGKEPGYPDTQI